MRSHIFLPLILLPWIAGAARKNYSHVSLVWKIGFNFLANKLVILSPQGL